MCGIFGISIAENANISGDEIIELLEQLYKFSESRGKESAGIHVLLPKSQKSWTLKSARPASEFIKLAEYKNIVSEMLSEQSKNRGDISVIAHSRLVTNGLAEDDKNNQPVYYGDVCVVHNGIIANIDELWQKHPHLKRHAVVDTEAIAAILSQTEQHKTHPITSTEKLFSEIEGAASIAWVNDKSNFMVLATNTGDLFYNIDGDKKVISFASERYILKEAIKSSIGKEKEYIDITWVKPNTKLYIQLADLKISEFSNNNTNTPSLPVYSASATHQAISSAEQKSNKNILITNKDADESLPRYSPDSLKQLKRCSRCVLPETFPFIHFDDDGVCNYCHGYQPKYKHLNPDEAKRDFIASLQKYKGNGTDIDVIVPFSGGRDSCYGLHLIKKEFGLTPISFTYDWGMVTDLARRNIARICGKLGVQNILVSADIKTKRENIRKNVAAWLKKPDLGMVPLFMAGDKHFFSVVNQLKKQTGVKLDLWCANPLENTDFKSGFCGIKPDFDKKRLDYLSAGRKLKMISHFAGQFITNPAYINSSLLDSLSSFFAYYIEPRRDFYFIFNHMVWNEDEVNKTIIDEYNFELSPDSSSTWRIGDGTAPFYNYIYVTTRGFSEFDTFRSNQIREGVISRDYAMERILDENKPRTESLRWYLDTIGLDFDSTIKAINKLDNIGLHS
ncbi:MAG: hypothetical protein R3D71_03090 [Rickettsiales bacterium]